VYTKFISYLQYTKIQTSQSRFKRTYIQFSFEKDQVSHENVSVQGQISAVQGPEMTKKCQKTRCFTKKYNKNVQLD